MNSESTSSNILWAPTKKTTSESSQTNRVITSETRQLAWNTFTDIINETNDPSNGSNVSTPRSEAPQHRSASLQNAPKKRKLTQEYNTHGITLFPEIKTPIIMNDTEQNIVTSLQNATLTSIA